ncbi:unnamed protein product [Lactuca saligna]|uniref:Uncharacterized protein n=1 Tax=Lactuca saligna TaxID=75948 RepID=A0AA35Z6W2_LACSI|nr:unnamed protein product [Lactuca saligna]
MMSESERMDWEQRDKELDKVITPWKDFEAKEAEAKNVKLVLETQMSLFPAWSHERIQKEVMDDPNLYSIEPTISFDLNKDVECQFNFPITPRAFLFRHFEKIRKSMISDSAENRKAFFVLLEICKTAV